MKKINIHKHIYPLFFKYFRTHRMRAFSKQFKLDSHTHILDVGGTEFNWSLISESPMITFLNLTAPKDKSNRGKYWIIADGTALPFKDKAFDIVYSNSVVEHLGSFKNQKLFASECVRVGINYYIQTPNKWFPVEPHYIMLFIHWLPVEIQKRLIRNFSIRGLVTRPSQQECDEMVGSIRLLNKIEVQHLFPDATIWQERFLGWIKSFTAIKLIK